MSDYDRDAVEISSRLMALETLVYMMLNEREDSAKICARAVKSIDGFRAQLLKSRLSKENIDFQSQVARSASESVASTGMKLIE